MSAPIRRRRIVAVAGAGALVLSSLVIGTAQAAHPEVSLAGINFEIDTDANLKLDDPAPSIDWGSISEVRQPDAPSGAQDDSFGQGTKEDTTVPTVVDGSIPPNKSDLLNFGFYLEKTASNGDFLHLFWHRVQEPSGTTNMDFEFNKSEETTANGVTPVRSEGDVLIQYDLSQGGTNPQLFVAYWLTDADFKGTAVTKANCVSANAFPCWGLRTNLTASGNATGSINTAAIPAAESDGLGNVSPRTFGEASVDFDAIAGSGCSPFGSAYLKSRSSDSFTAALKDFIAPVETGLDNCGTVTVIKHTDPGGVDQDFSFSSTLAGTEMTCTTDTSPATFILNDAGTDTETCENVPAGSYTVTEGANPAGFAFQGASCVATTGSSGTVAGKVATINLIGAGEVTCTYVNERQLGAIKVTKTRKHAASGPGDHPHAGVNFTVNGVTKPTDANGVACFDGLLFGDYTVHETEPAGYADVADQVVTVNNDAQCSETPYDGETVSFSNTPLTNVTVSVNSQVDGGTASVISCTDSNGNTTGGSTGANGDGSHSVNNLLPTDPTVTLTCTITVDP